MSNAIQFVTDAKGDRTAVVIPLVDYEQLMEDIQDLADIVDRRSD
jgi:PHD/YefM family antitoxin component YafN of YafNO toxin-antitoxin module